mgnify:CR=1 FL=1
MLDVGTGPGFFAIILAEMGFRVTAVDYTASMLEEAGRNAGALADKIDFRQMNAEKLTFADHSFDVLVTRNVTWNLHDPETAYGHWTRVLAPGGALVYAVPGPRHLFGLKQVLYDTPYENPCRPVEYPGFVREAERAVQGTIRLEGGAIQDLFAMTPYYWKTPKEGAERLAKLEVLQTEIEFRFVIYRKQG